MARRTRISEDEPLTRQELVDLRARLAQMTEHELQIFYKATWNQCQLRPWGRRPKIRFLQELVQAWKSIGRAQ